MSRGHNRERALKALLEAEDWLVVRAAGSLGVADLVALRDGSRPRIIEVKSDVISPYDHFRPADRSRLKLAAAIAGAEPWLVWWPPRAKPRWISANEWPGVNVLRAEACPNPEEKRHAD